LIRFAAQPFYVGTLKGVGRVYQQSFIDADATVAFANSTTARPRSPPPSC
jgi:hypothetical protein